MDKLMALEFAPAEVDVERLHDGGVVIRSPLKLESYAANICWYLVDWAEKMPDRTSHAKRSATGEELLTVKLWRPFAHWRRRCWPIT